MNTCKNCNAEFPNWFMIDGKLRNLSARQHCLLCSPFGKHNTRKVLTPQTSKFCNPCNKELPIKYFYPRGKGVTPYCRKCTNIKSGVIRQKLKEKAVNYKGGKCELCFYSKCLSALEFHHIDPNEKDFTISDTKMKWETIQKELDKCQLLCANCHRETHDIWHP